MAFFNRSDEVAALERRFGGRDAELLVLYGRRRVGKTELLTHLSERHRSLYFEATDAARLDQLRDLSQELARASGDELIAQQPLTSWEAALTTIARFVGKQRTLVVLDEFQWLARQAPELETTLSRWWRTTGRRLPIMLVLAGSELSFFEDNVLAGQLYGRRTGQLKLLPFSPRDAALFHPAYSPEDRVRAYAVCGGIPYYLDRFRDGAPLERHILEEILSRDGLLYEEAELALRQSLAEPRNHASVLRAIAQGQTRNSQIINRTGLTPSHVNAILGQLERLGLVEQQRPVTASPRSKKTSYAIADEFLGFHFRFVDGARSRLRTMAQAREYLKRVVMPDLDAFVSRPAWERICQERVREEVDAAEVGRWWGPVPTGEGRRTEQRELDIVALDHRRRPLAVGACKWTSQPVDLDELTALERLAPFVPGAGDNPCLYLFSRSGFTPRLRRRARDRASVRLRTPRDIYRRA